ncbi:MAG: protein of unknown function DUF1360 [uncultured Quadrisphaera sp.]|uniref:Integral membrane protein n=1 Tax=uncultured Quadrisphaera sp. TaxID=904978 RepID=A0A6J4PUG1_9ACTN|nr:MAG: protein of unknown function DUF1360 [uncultured Quadrisphaera sp.]
MTDAPTPGAAPDADARLDAFAHRHHGPLATAAAWWLRNRTTYEAGRGDERPLTGYALLASLYGAATSTAVAVLRSRPGRAALPDRADLAVLAVAVFATTRTLTKDAVTTPLRSPFATFEQAGAPGEVVESPRSGAVRHAVGELVTCPFCLAQWVGTAYLAGWAAAPRATRWVASTMAVVGASNLLQHGYGVLTSASEG